VHCIWTQIHTKCCMHCVWTKKCISWLHSFHVQLQRLCAQGWAFALYAAIKHILIPSAQPQDQPGRAQADRQDRGADERRRRAAT